MELEIERFDGHSSALVDLLWSLESQMFDPPYAKEKIHRESSVKPNLISLIAYTEGAAVGYKVGYEMTARLFYSWTGGVLPACRHQGVAAKLMLE